MCANYILLVRVVQILYSLTDLYLVVTTVAEVRFETSIHYFAFVYFFCHLYQFLLHVL